VPFQCLTTPKIVRWPFEEVKAQEALPSGGLLVQHRKNTIFLKATEKKALDLMLRVFKNSWVAAC
jgi:hypothetical protein